MSTPTPNTAKKGNDFKTMYTGTVTNPMNTLDSSILLCDFNEECPHHHGYRGCVTIINCYVAYCDVSRYQELVAPTG